MDIEARLGAIETEVKTMAKQIINLQDHGGRTRQVVRATRKDVRLMSGEVTLVRQQLEGAITWPRILTGLQVLTTALTAYGVLHGIYPH